jgi:hypothetical protein
MAKTGRSLKVRRPLKIRKTVAAETLCLEGSSSTTAACSTENENGPFRPPLRPCVGQPEWFVIVLFLLRFPSEN